MRRATLFGNHVLVNAAISSSVLLVSALRQYDCSGIWVKPANHTRTNTTSPPRNTPNNPPIALSVQSEPMAFNIFAASLVNIAQTNKVKINTKA